MSDNEACLLKSPTRTPWNKGKLIGAKPPLRPKHVWCIRTKLQVDGRLRDLAMFKLAIDSKLRRCRSEDRRYRTWWILGRPGDRPSEEDGSVRARSDIPRCPVVSQFEIW